MLIKDLIKELEKLPQDAMIGGMEWWLLWNSRYNNNKSNRRRNI